MTQVATRSTRRPRPLVRGRSAAFPALRLPAGPAPVRVQALPVAQRALDPLTLISGTDHLRLQRGQVDVVALLDLYGFHHASERGRLLRLAEEVWRTDRWDEDYGDVVDASFIDYPWLESRSESVCCFHFPQS